MLIYTFVRPSPTVDNGKCMLTSTKDLIWPGKVHWNTGFADGALKFVDTMGHVATSSHGSVTVILQLKFSLMGISFFSR